MVNPSSAIVFVVDRLGAGFLGPYGNTWIETQHCNRLASGSLLCEFAVSDSLELGRVYRSYWTGLHAMSGGDGSSPLADLAGKAGLKTILLTDEQLVAEHPLAAGFAETIVLPQRNVPDAAAEVEETAIARLAQRGMELVARQGSPYLLWIHSRGMGGAWDAPREFRDQFRDEDDPQPGDFTAPPLVKAARNFDPDELLRYVHAYAGQVALFDLCLGALLDSADEHPAAAETLFAFTSPRGYPLGEHGQVGPVEEFLYGEVLNVPLIVRFPGGKGALARAQELVQPHDIFELLGGLFSPKQPSVLWDLAEGRVANTRDIACAIAPDERAIRTPAWFLREVRGAGLTGEHAAVELFAKPDDRWEVNEIASRAGEVTEQLLAALDEFEGAAREGRLAKLPPLSQALCDQWR